MTRFYTDPAAFRAVVLHELAHLRNRDLDQTYFTVVLWYAFLLAAIVPYILSLYDEGGRTVWRLGWRLAALTALVYLTRNAVLRAREVYADVRASITEPTGIRTVLSSLAERPRRLRDRLLGLHPDPAHRLAAVEDTERLFALRLVEIFGAGIATTIAYEGVASLIGFYELDSQSTMWWSALVFAPLAAAVLVIGLWRSTFVRLALGRRAASALSAGAALGVGFLVGQELSLRSAVVSEDVVLGTGRGDLFSAVLVVGGLALFAGWVATAAELWLPVAGSRSPRWVTAAAVAATGTVLTVAMGIFFLARDTRGVIHDSIASTALEHDQVATIAWAGPTFFYQFVLDPEIATFVHRSVVWPAVIVLWAFPLAALLTGARRGRRVFTWGALGEPGVVLEQPLVRVRRAAMIGLAGAATVLLAALVLRAVVHNAVSETTRSHGEFSIGFYVWNVSLGLLAMAVVAGITAATCRRAGMVLALFAAALTGIASAITLFAYGSLASCVGVLGSGPCGWSVSGSFARRSFEQMFAQGTLAALIGGGIGALGAAAAARRNVETPSPMVAA